MEDSLVYFELVCRLGQRLLVGCNVCVEAENKNTRMNHFRVRASEDEEKTRKRKKTVHICPLEALASVEKWYALDSGKGR